MAVVAGLAEIAGGLALRRWSLDTIGAALIILTMLIAIIKVHGKNGYWVTSNGFEYNLALIADRAWGCTYRCR